MNKKINILNKKMLLVLLLTGSMHSSSIKLKYILSAATKDSPLVKSLIQDTSAQNEKNLAKAAPDPFELYTEGTKARPDFGKDGYEFAVGISKKFKLGSIQEEERSIAQLSSEAYSLEARAVLIDFQNNLKNLYHQSCIESSYYATLRKSYLDLVKLYGKKEKAYKYNEISKIELIQLRDEKKRLYAQLQEIKMTEAISRDKLLYLSRVGSSKKNKLYCKDLYTIRKSIKLQELFGLSKKAHKKRMESTKKRIKRHSHVFDSIQVSAQYGRELDMKKYTVGLSLPLTFSSNRAEHEKKAAMHRYSALEHGYVHDMREKKSVLRELKAQLRSNALMIKTLSSSYRSYKNSVLPLIKKSYDLGETSVIEYLLSRKKMYTLSRDIYIIKKSYYRALFQLYALSQKKDSNE